MSKDTNSINIPPRKLVPAKSDVSMHKELGYQMDCTNWFTNTTFAEQDYRTPWHQLLVIGNGFDLACGLKSKYSDFRAARRPLFSQQPVSRASEVESALDNGPQYTKNLWDMILDANRGKGWSDIEGTIAAWVTSSITGKNKLSTVVDWLNTYKRLDDYRVAHFPSIEAKVAEFILGQYPLAGESWEAPQLVGIFSEQLGVFERDFSAYLSHEVDSTPGCANNAKLLLHDLLADELPDEKDFNPEESILSFNYTRPIEQSPLADRPIYYVNIHGRLGDEIVFGIDGKDRMKDPTAVPFTKTYRIMALSNVEKGKLVRVPHLGSGATDSIKFFGHSLAPADYSYFQALFDAVDLYAGNTRLIFYYKPYDTGSHRGGGDSSSEDKTRRDVEEARRQMMGKVVSLLNRYGETFDNRDHGKNLMHKLLLEGRLSVKLVPGYRDGGPLPKLLSMSEDIHSS